MSLSEKQIKFAAMVGKLLSHAAEQGIPAKVGTWYRSPEVQAALLKRKATQLSHSKHQDGLAVDLCIIRGGQLPNDDPGYDNLGAFWESIGGTWGGRWKTLHDRDHFEFKEA